MNKSTVYKPVIDGKWWRICEMPDLHELNNDNLKMHNVVDHGFYLDDDGLWHLWAAIRGTKIGHPICSWTGTSLEEGPWNYQGVVLRADKKYSENVKPDGKELVCAPFFITHENIRYCFYNSKGIHWLKETEKNVFQRVLNQDDSSLSHPGGRDPMLLKIGDTWFAYSCVTTVSADSWAKSFVIVRTSKNLIDWSDFTIVSEGGIAGNGPVSAESPFVVFKAGLYYLFRASSMTFTTFVYCSDNPYNFGVNDDSRLIAELPIKAPEIIFHNEQYYISDLEDFQGIKLAKLNWEKISK